MANTTTRLNLRDRARRAADCVNSQFVTDAELNDWLNVSLSELHDLLVQSFEDYFETQQVTTVPAGTTTIALPTDFLKAIGVDWAIGGETISLPRYMPGERNLYNTVIPITGAGAGLMFYRIVGQELRLIPDPGAGILTLRYVPQFAPLLLDTALVNVAVPQGWEEYAVIDTAIRIMIKEESDISALQLQKDRLQARIAQAAQSRDAGEPWRIVDMSTTPRDVWLGQYT